MRPLLGILAAALAVVGYPRYVAAVARRDVRPAVASWCAWLVSALVVGTSQVVDGAGWATALTAAQVVGLATVLVLALRRATWVATTLERACITLALSGALLSVALHDPGVAVAAAITGNIIAGIPTYRSVWRRPQDEGAALWLCCSLGGALSALAAPSFTLARAGYGIYLFVADLCIGLLALRRPSGGVAAGERRGRVPVGLGR